jgi:hypothetical protein
LAPAIEQVDPEWLPVLGGEGEDAGGGSRWVDLKPQVSHSIVDLERRIAQIGAWADGTCGFSTGSTTT